MALGQELGHVSISDKDGTGTPTMTLSSEIKVGGKKRVAQYELRTTDDNLNLSAFIAPDAGSVRFIGTVEHRCDLRTKLSEDYRTVVRDRTEANKRMRSAAGEGAGRAQQGISIVAPTMIEKVRYCICANCKRSDGCYRKIVCRWMIMKNVHVEIRRSCSTICSNVSRSDNSGRSRSWYAYHHLLLCVM